MKIQNLTKHFRLFLPILLTATLCLTGCETSKRLWATYWFSGGSAQKPAPDPLKGWTFKPFPGWEVPPYGHNTNHLDSAVVDDYQKFIADQHLGLSGPITGFYEDAMGRHAVEFVAFPPNQNATWNYVLIYDKESRRAKTIRYTYVKYKS
ncbi:MAG: hypothetical protein ACREFR_01925 [Limisphaerales bacterium]